MTHNSELSLWHLGKDCSTLVVRDCLLDKTSDVCRDRSATTAQQQEEASCWVTVEQSPFVLGLTSENGELLLDECVQVTEGSKTKDRHLFLFSDVIVFAKLKSNASYRLKHRVSLEDIWLCGFEDEEDEEGMTGDIDFRVTLVLAWALTFCLVCFR
uniref:rho GTPase-activating protein 20-like n=1 Tax=Scatophagus argus TaxID=75038 RepID=UPI001ED7F04E|nr:rho GTPase-activating protein 20-like [Scatophagus argus]